MKKIYTLALLVFSVFVLTACSSQEAWLNGTWKSEKTKSTYVFEEKQGKWNILNGKEKIAEKGEVKDKKGDQFTLDDFRDQLVEMKKMGGMLSQDMAARNHLLGSLPALLAQEFPEARARQAPVQRAARGLPGAVPRDRA